MKTVSMLLSQRVISEYERQGFQLRDSRIPALIFRYAKKPSVVGTFHCRITKNGFTTSQVLGTYPITNIEQARNAASTLLLEYEKNKQVKIKVSKFETLGELLSWYIDFRIAQPQLKLATEKNIRHQIGILLIPVLGDWRIDCLDAGKLAEFWFLPTSKLFCIATARGAFQCLKAAFNQAFRLDYIQLNPIQTVNFSHITPTKVKHRESKIEHYTLKQLIKWLSKFPEPQRVFCLLCLSYLTRNQETTLARWTDLDFERRTWRIPAENTKTGQEIIHPLSPEIIALLKRYKAWQRSIKRSVFLFPQKRGGKNITASQISHRICALSKGQLRLHDLRKYGSSYLREMGVDYYIVERILNHRKTTLDATYIHSSMKEIIRSALFTWHLKIFNPTS